MDQGTGIYFLMGWCLFNSFEFVIIIFKSFGMGCMYTAGTIESGWNAPARALISDKT